MSPDDFAYPIAPDARQFLDQCPRIRFGNVEEGDVRALSHEALDHARTDPRPAAGDEHALAGE